MAVLNDQRVSVILHRIEAPFWLVKYHHAHGKFRSFAMNPIQSPIYHVSYHWLSQGGAPYLPKVLCHYNV